MGKIIIISLVVMFACLFLFKAIDPKLSVENGPDEISIVDETKVSVTIEGEIVSPGIYQMEVTQSIRELVDSAGGLTENADENAINLDTVIGQRDYVYVAAKKAVPSTCEIVDIQKININKATATELATLNYISFALAEKIVKYREENGEFQSLEDVMNVSGIGRATYERIRDYITLK